MPPDSRQQSAASLDQPVIGADVCRGHLARPGTRALPIVSASLCGRTLGSPDCTCALTLAGIASRGSAGGAATRPTWLAMALPLKQGKVSMVKARLSRWLSRWRERRLAREQTRQTSAARDATRAAERDRYHSTGHGL